MEEAQAQSLLSSHHRTTRKPLPDLSGKWDVGKQDVEVGEQELYTKSKGSRFSSCEAENALFFGLLITSSISSILVVAQQRGWVLSSSLYDFVENNRASTQIVVQLLSNVFTFIQVTILCTLVNRATRLRFNRTKASLNHLRFWSHLCALRISWRLPLEYLLPLLLFMGVTVIPSALWAGALSPITVSKTCTSSVRIPSYDNTSLILEYPSEFGDVAQRSEVRNTKGVFSYNVGITMEGALLSSASSATTVDGSPRKHVKLDNSGFTYIGRSYGVGAPAGLMDDNILNNTFTMSYIYQETGYNVGVKCIYNSSTDFVLISDDISLLWEAVGPLPNSNGAGERSTYIGRDDGPSIVAIGVAAAQTNGTKYVGIAAGSNYAFLNETQCSVDYIPTLFNITVDVKAKNITVLPISSSEDINLEGNIAHTSTRQLELISNDQTNLYQSLLGNSFMSSIGNYNISQENSTTPPTEATATLVGVTNAVAAMLDDILVGYASAQLMVGNQSTVTEAVVTTMALKIRQRGYIYAIFVFNLVIVIITFEEAIRTMFWREMGKWNYMDIEAVIVSSWKGGCRNIAEALGDRGGKMANKISGLDWMVNKSQVSTGSICGKTWVTLGRDTDTLLLDYEKEV
ncbi:hypothetical protein EG329_012877 [Mollisiaceae sp. DMI_Dod_QoI]|nr:hypothetical protein EG329_012877 [Helotiales sp. DMI_Dod_QoI]